MFGTYLMEPAEVTKNLEFLLHEQLAFEFVNVKLVWSNITWATT